MPTMSINFEELPYDIRLKIFKIAILETFFIIHSSWPTKIMEKKTMSDENKMYKRQLSVPNHFVQLGLFAHWFFRPELNGEKTISLEEIMNQKSIRLAGKQKSIFFTPHELLQECIVKDPSGKEVHYKQQPYASDDITGVDKVEKIALYASVHYQQGSKNGEPLRNLPRLVQQDPYIMVEALKQFPTNFPDLKIIYICLQQPTARQLEEEKSSGGKWGFIKGTTGMIPTRNAAGKISEVIQDAEELKRISSLFSYAGKLRNTLKREYARGKWVYFKDVDIEIVQWGKVH